ncbi:MAG TPA: AraC family transcriptional regulator [Acidobacteriaceae bacterium]|jgi:AraC-like DNA-binding protein|nr:AraC family transcriptional regulator [Acidobacteriaceae bacterium]
MTFLERKPGVELRPWVRSLWYAQGMDLVYRRERILPTGRAQIILNLARDFILDCPPDRPTGRMAPALLVGQRSVHEIVDTSDMQDLIGIVFEPGALPAFLVDSADRVTNSFVALDEVCRASGALRDRLRELPGAEARLACLEGYLWDKLARRSGAAGVGIHPAVQYALERIERAPHVGTVAEVARSTGWSERRLSQVFREQVGLSPKVWCRVQRFQRVVRQLHHGEAVRWPELALECGFYDQSHLANEFRAFSGIPPTAYAGASSQRWANHLRAE